MTRATSQIPPLSGRGWRWVALLLWCVCALGCLSGCSAGHAARTLQARQALNANRPNEALALLNEELEVDDASQLPDDTSGDKALLLLDRAMVLQQLERYELSSRDLEVADKQVELLDFSRDAVDDLGKYMFSDDVGPYRAPPYEKLMLNTVNIANYLVRGDLSGARVESRRLAVMQKYLADHEDQGVSLTGLGSYLAGFTFEKSRRPQEALRYYDQALQYGEYPSLVEPVRRLALEGSYRTPRITRLLGDADTSAEPGPQPAEILVIVSYGRVPAKHAERVPVGLALTWAAGNISPRQHATASRLAAQGLVTWVNYPELGRPRGRFSSPTVAVDGYSVPAEGILAVDLEAKKAWEEVKGAMTAAAITRMITRAVAGEAVRQASGEGAIGLLLSLGTQATLTAADTPDTRSWATLPARVSITRVRVKPGSHWVEVVVRGVAKRQQVRVEEGSFAVVNMTVLS